MKNKCRMQNNEYRIECCRVERRLLFCVLPSAICIGSLGCAEQKGPTTRPETARERQDRAMRDPFGYSTETGKADISGGGISDFDREGFNRDLNNVLDP
jgi:hypothetical protein